MKKHKTASKAVFGQTATDSSSGSDNGLSDLQSDLEAEAPALEELRANYKQVNVSHVEDPSRIYVTLASRQKKLQE